MEAREIGDELMATVCLRFSAKSDAARDGSPICAKWASMGFGVAFLALEVPGDYLKG